MSAAAAGLLLSGYYGFDNFGDEAILQIVSAEWRRRRPQDSLTVLSARPHQTARAFGVRALPRTSMPAVRAAMRHSQVFISGGGGLLQSSTSLRSLLYYAGLLHQAKRNGCKSVIFAQGIGPLSFTGKQIVKRTCAEVDLAILRDAASATLLHAILPNLDIRVGADPMFLADEPPSQEAVLQSEGIAPDASLVAVVVRPSRMLDRLQTDIANAIDLIADRFRAQVVLVPFQRPLDVEAAVAIIRRCKSAPVLLSDNYTLARMGALFKRCSAIVAMRLHALILAARLGVPFLAIAYDPKINALLESLRYPLPALQPHGAAELVTRLWNERSALRAALVTAVTPLQHKAIQSFDWLQTLVEGAVS